MEIRSRSAPGTARSRNGGAAGLRRDGVDLRALPQIFHYWSNRYLKPRFEKFGFCDPDAFFVKETGALLAAARASSKRLLRIASLGSGACDFEIMLAGALVEAGHRGFVIECVSARPSTLERGMVRAHEEGVDAHLVPIAVDADLWRPDGVYDAVLANHALHRSKELEHVFAAVRGALAPDARFLVSAYVGRNGHRRWPEALAHVNRFWKDLPSGYRYNAQLDRVESTYGDWDYAKASADAIRAQEILPQLIGQFAFDFFVGYANVIEPFVGRAFGHNFDADATRDRAFIDRVHACDEAEIAAGRIKPTNLLAVLTAQSPGRRVFEGTRTPESAVRNPDDAASA